MSDGAELRDRVARAIWETRFSSNIHAPADAALAALGLDDLDAAVERYHDGTRRFAAERHRGWTRDADEAVRAGLEAVQPASRPLTKRRRTIWLVRGAHYGSFTLVAKLWHGNAGMSVITVSGFAR